MFQISHEQSLILLHLHNSYSRQLSNLELGSLLGYDVEQSPQVERYLSDLEMLSDLDYIHCALESFGFRPLSCGSTTTYSYSPVSIKLKANGIILADDIIKRASKKKFSQAKSFDIEREIQMGFLSKN